MEIGDAQLPLLVEPVEDPVAAIVDDEDRQEVHLPAEHDCDPVPVA